MKSLTKAVLILTIVLFLTSCRTYTYNVEIIVENWDFDDIYVMVSTMDDATIEPEGQIMIAAATTNAYGGTHYRINEWTITWKEDFGSSSFFTNLDVSCGNSSLHFDDIDGADKITIKYENGVLQEK